MSGIKLFIGARSRAAMRLIRALSQAKGLAAALSPELVYKIDKLQHNMTTEWDKDEALSLDNIGAVTSIDFAKKGAQVLNECWPTANMDIVSSMSMYELVKIRGEFISIAEAASRACETIDEVRRLKVGDNNEQTDVRFSDQMVQ